MKPSKRNRLINIVGSLFIILLLVEVGQTIKKNYGLRQQIQQLENDVATLEEEKIELGYRIAYYQTDAYKEKEARAKLGLQKPGESVVIIAEPEDSEPKTKKAPKPKPNWQQWWEFLTGRSV